MRRALPLLATLLVSGVLSNACGDTPDQAADSKDARQRAAASRDRERRISRLERRLAQLEARNQSVDEASTQAGSRLSPAFSRAFNRFATTLHGSAGATLGPPGHAHVESLGSLEIGSAWSTIKVAIALRVLERRGGPTGLTSGERSAIDRALTASDNSAAAQLFKSLGDTSTAAAAVEQVLKEAGDLSTHVSTVGRGSFSPYGQTEWALTAQHRFMAALAGGCVGDSASRRYLLGLMGRVTSDSWGLGSVGLPSRWKSGWGPDPGGRYLARQMGVVKIRSRDLVVTLAVRPADGSFASAQSMATKVARWVTQQGARFAGRRGRC